MNFLSGRFPLVLPLGNEKLNISSIQIEPTGAMLMDAGHPIVTLAVVVDTIKH